MRGIALLDASDSVTMGCNDSGAIMSFCHRAIFCPPVARIKLSRECHAGLCSGGQVAALMALMYVGISRIMKSPNINRWLWYSTTGREQLENTGLLRSTASSSRVPALAGAVKHQCKEKQA